MLDLLRRVGFDVEAKISSLKVGIEARAQQFLHTVKEDARSYAVAAALFMGAGVFAFLLLLVGLAALFVSVAEAHGPLMGFAFVGLTLLIMCAGCSVGGAMVLKKRPSRPYLIFPPPVISPGVVPSSDMAESSARVHPLRPTARSMFQEIVVPLVSLVSRYRPVTGNWGVDGVIRHVGSPSQATAKDAVYRAADLVQHGSRGTMLTVLAVAIALGWLATTRRSR